MKIVTYNFDLFAELIFTIIEDMDIINLLVMDKIFLDNIVLVNIQEILD
jgi:hypothetical protein